MYLLNLGGAQLTELNGTGAERHTNAWAGGKLLATYDFANGGLHYALTDWLGTKRVQVSGSGSTLGTAELNCYNLPFGNNLGDVRISDCRAVGSGAADATEHHFTGKERDTESGNDYFGARYYASSMGRFMSPDPGPFVWRDPQTLNRYGYTRNNPLKYVDPTGMFFVVNSGDELAKQAISTLLRSNTGRALINSIASDSRPTYVSFGKTLGVRLSKVLGDDDGGVSDWRKPELVVESVS